MTIIGSTTYSYAIYSGLTAGKSQTNSTPSESPANTRSTVSSALTGGQIGSDDGASAKLSSALWDLTSSNAASAKQEDVWQDGGETRTDAEQEFGDLANRSLAEILRAKYLEEKNLTEEDLARMPAEQREAIEAEIREAIKQALGIDTQDGADTAGNSAA
ncbi:hypothetical protein J2T09_001287 [Neorhizobium huautlense]|uniref:Uncharacterized protein n=1 Tax=Neorhizobium huautlense TaxID=67774 RepID=A0ABT9PPZ3_9HYPH|nr:hypothetical protein [Neorhizobium huautlense]MDP9836543.1 hypothetical protein [Neorhizobium huautlense]